MDNIRGHAFLSVYNSVEQPGYYEVIVHDERMFMPHGFRAIEKFLRSAIKRAFAIPDMYSIIRAHIGRPMTREEMVVVSQHIHRLYLNR